MADDEVPPRPRRERPLRASDRDDVGEQDLPPAPPPPTVTTPPVGPPVIEFATPPDEPEREDHVVVSFDGPTPQRRWTIALRFILVVPHVLWLMLLGFAAFFVGIVAWIAALFTARVPDGMANFLASVVEYQTRLYGYGYLLLSDEYPPFALGGDYAITVRTSPGRLNRAAVFFRVILMVPGYIVSAVAVAGAQVVGFVGWLLALIMGRLPTPLWEANAAALRYFTRFNAFTLMLSAEQPGGLFGDKPLASPSTDAAIDALDLPERPRISRLVLSKPGRRIVVLFIVLGAVVQIGSSAVSIANAVRTSAAYRQLDESHRRLVTAVNVFGLDTQQCAATSGGLPCLHAADAQLARAFDRFVEDVQTISFPSTVDASELIADARDCALALRHLAATETPAAYGAAANEFQTAANAFDSDYADFAYSVDYND